MLRNQFAKGHGGRGKKRYSLDGKGLKENEKNKSK